MEKTNVQVLIPLADYERLRMLDTPEDALFKARGEGAENMIDLLSTLVDHMRVRKESMTDSYMHSLIEKMGLSEKASKQFMRVAGRLMSPPWGM